MNNFSLTVRHSLILGGKSSISDDQWRHRDASAELLMRAIFVGIDALWQSSGVNLDSCYHRESPGALGIFGIFGIICSI